MTIYGPNGERLDLPAEDAPHGLTPMQIERLKDRFDQFIPKTAGGTGAPKTRLDGVLPEGASWGQGFGKGYREAVTNTDRKARMEKQGSNPLDFGASTQGGYGGSTYMTTQRPYQPEFESPDRQQYPVHRILANRYWRLFYKLDATIGNGVDMLADLPFSDFELTGEGVDGEVKDMMEACVDACQLRSVLPYMVREFLVVGEACPHMFFDNDRGYWTYIALHNPDQIDVIDAPFIDMDPVVEFIPDPRLQQVVTSSNPQLQRVRESMPPELLSRLTSRQNIPLSPVNFTFLPRKLHPYDTRGTSIISRMWRILMYEDSIFNASIATARRHAGPIKVAKLGDATTGYIPGPEQEQKLLEQLAQAELDVNAWLVYHYALSFELVGSTERVMTIDKHYELIERIKLVALGISKAFLHGEVTYASAASGLTVFMHRLKAMRQYFENKWLYPKFFLQLAKINKWVKPTEAELSSRVRVRRSASELMEDQRYILPRVEWDRALDPTVDADMIGAMQTLEGMGVKFSKSTKMALVGRDFEEELQQRVKDSETEQEVLKDHPQLMQEEMGGGPEGGGGGIMPGIPGESFGPELGGDGGEGEVADIPVDVGEPAAEAGYDAAEGEQGAPDPFKESDRVGIWTKSDVRDLVDMMEGETPEEEPWVDAFKQPRVQEALKSQDADEIWEAVEEYLSDDFPASSIIQLEQLLKTMRVLRGPAAPAKRRAKQHEAQLSDMVPDDNGDDRFLSGF